MLFKRVCQAFSSLSGLAIILSCSNSTYPEFVQIQADFSGVYTKWQGHSGRTIKIRQGQYLILDFWDLGPPFTQTIAEGSALASDDDLTVALGGTEYKLFSNGKDTLLIDNAELFIKALKNSKPEKALAKFFVKDQWY